jgi:chorismate mutase
MAQLLKLRQQIDLLDDQIITLLNRRFRHSRKIGNLKARGGDKIYCRGREKQILHRIGDYKVGPLSSKEIQTIYSLILKLSRRHQSEIIRQVRSH